MLHEIPLGRETIHGHFSASLAPVLTVDPGDSVRFQALDAWWRWEPGRGLLRTISTPCWTTGIR